MPKRFKPPSAGDFADNLLLDVSYHRALIELLNAWSRGDLNSTPEVSDYGIRMTLENTSGNDRAMGELMYIEPFAPAPTGTGADEVVQKEIMAGPNSTMIDPVWHTSIDNLVALQVDVPSTAGANMYAHPLAHIGVVKGSQANVDDRFVMPDPANPYQVLSADAGIWQIIGFDGTDLFLVDFRLNQQFWRYELTQDSQQPGDTTAKLLRLDGTEFTNSPTTEINLSDPDGLMDDQASGDKGWCFHAGNKFYAIQAVCA